MTLPLIHDGLRWSQDVAPAADCGLDAALDLVPPVEGGLLVLVLIVDVSVFWSVPLATRYMRQQVVKAKEAISPLLPQGEETYLRVFAGLGASGRPSS